MTLGNLLIRLMIAMIISAAIFGIWNAGQRVQHVRNAQCRAGVVWMCDK